MDGIFVIGDRFRLIRPFKFRTARRNMSTYDGAKGYHTTIDGVPVRKIYVGNLPRAITPNEIMKKFSNYGVVRDIIIIPPLPQKANTFGFVTFCTPFEATRAMNDHLIFLHGRKLFISPADSWHQPEELPNGEIVWDRRTILNNQFETDDQNDEGGDEEEEEVELINDEKTCPISILNDDCLHLIFNHLSLSERLVIGRVCKRWRKVNETMWHRIKKLDFSIPPLSEELLTNNTLKLYLTLCPNITSLNIANPDHALNSGAIVSIAKHSKYLEELTIRNIPIQKRSLALLAKNCPNLMAFYMNACDSHHDSEMITLVKKCKQLQRIGLKFSTSLSGAWLKYLKCPLQSLSLEMYEMKPDYLLEGIANVQSTLKELAFISCPAIRYNDLNAIAELVPNLTYLTLAGMFTLVNYKNVLALNKLKNLIRLDLEQNCFVCDDFMNDLVENCPSLNHLNLTGTNHIQLTEKGLMLISKFSHLTHLQLGCHDVLNDKILKAISNKVKNLRHLDVMGCQSITDQGCSDIITNCKELESLNVSGCTNVSNLTILAAMKKIENGCRKKLHIIAGTTRVMPENLFIKPEVQPYLYIDLQSTIMSHYEEDFYATDEENSDFSIDEFDIFDDESNQYYDFYSDPDDIDQFDSHIWI